jgi:hypothetical protein
MDNTYKNKFAIIVLFTVLCLIGMVACNSTENAEVIDPGSQVEPENGNGESTAETEEPASEDSYQIAWQNSPHADSFVVDAAGRNNLCGRCHAPINWQPTLDDIPPSCFTCKFDLEEPDPLIPEADWLDIPCHVCHEKDKKGNVQPEVMWLEIPAFEEYAEVASATELCQKCHGEAGYEDHGVVQVGGAHVDYGCIDCHEPHDTVASCGAVDCHDDALGTSSGIPGHDEDHQSVTCVACHDGAEMALGLQEESGIFTTFETVVTDEGESSFPFRSHNILLESRCDRCHFSANPWDITEDVSQP